VLYGAPVTCRINRRHTRGDTPRIINNSGHD
jgi:hypothetical protein